jgi:hypothetical protein
MPRAKKVKEVAVAPTDAPVTPTDAPVVPAEEPAAPTEVPRAKPRALFQWIVAVLVIVAAFVISHPLTEKTMQISNGYGARIACSVVFVANRTLDSALAAELQFPPIKYLSSIEIDHDTKCAIAQSRFMSVKTVACWRGQRLGCVGHNGPFDIDTRVSPALALSAAWPLGEGESSGAAGESVDVPRVKAAVEAHFADASLQARGFVVVRKGEILLERYADGFDETTPLIGWSMSKSLMHALFAMRAKAVPDLLNLSSPIDLPEWEGDEKSQRTVRELLQMRDGYAFDENYLPGGSVTDMLFRRGETWGPEMDRHMRDTAQSACFQYSSTTTNILARLLKLSFERYRTHLPLSL